MQSLLNLNKLAFLERDLLEDRASRFATWRASDTIDEVLALLTEEAVFTVPGNRNVVPCFGRHAGKVAIQRLLQTFRIEYEVMSSDVRHVLVDGTEAAVQQVWVLRHRGTGIARRVHVFDFIRFENGLIAEVVSHVDTLAMAETMDLHCETHH